MTSRDEALRALEKAIELVAKATPGTWAQEHRRGSDSSYRTEVFDEHGEAIATLTWHAKPPSYEKGMKTISTDRAENAEAIIAAVNFIREHGSALLTTRQEVAPVAEDTAARALYARWVDAQNIHCNRFPSWGELDEETKNGWRSRVSPHPARLQHAINQFNGTASTGQTSDARDAVVTDAMVMAALDAQPLTDENESWRIWQIIGFDDARAKKIMRSALVAAMEASR